MSVREESEEEVGRVDLKPGRVRIQVVYDNVGFDSSFRTGFGFACFVEADDSILFDVGSDAPTLRNNLGVAGLSEPDVLVLSHDHYDHTGGLIGVLRKDLEVFVGEGFSDETKSLIKQSGAGLVEVGGAVNVSCQVGVTGEVRGPPVEQALMVSTRKGLVVVTGCAHPGADVLVERAAMVSGADVYLVLGGFHLGGAGEDEIMEVVSNLRDLGVSKVAPSHCTGDFARQLFRREFGDGFVESGVGKVFEIG